jgi:hypothetical protein
MRILYELSGGIAGMRRTALINTTADLSKEKFLRAKCEKGSGADMFNYSISIQHEVTADEDTKTARDLKPLINLLMSKVKTRKSSSRSNSRRS